MFFLISKAKCNIVMNVFFLMWLLTPNDSQFNHRHGKLNERGGSVRKRIGHLFLSAGFRENNTPAPARRE